MRNKWTLGVTSFLLALNCSAASTATTNTPQQCHYVKKCVPAYDDWKGVGESDLKVEEKSALATRMRDENAIDHNRFGIGFDEPTYVLPFYYTGNPLQDVGPTPRNQSIKNEELKAQLSFKFPIWPHIYGSHWSIGASYTQLMYWQVYDKSQFFRETDYEPAVFVSDHFRPNWLGSMGLVHQSNGRGGTYERSWNRAYANLTFSGTSWLVSVEPWILIFKADSSDLHNKNIAHYLGYERVVVAYKYHSQEWSAMLRNSVESGFQRLALELDYSFPIYGVLHGYVQFFHGYGQSLIEYDQKTNSFGVGLTLSNWI